MQFWNMALPYQLQIIWFLPIIAMPTLEEREFQNLFFLFSRLKIQYQQHSKGNDIFYHFLTSSDFLLCDARYFFHYTFSFFKQYKLYFNL